MDCMLKMARPLLTNTAMNTLLELVYKYRQLLGKCSTGAGLSMGEVETLSTIESLFGRHSDRGDTDLWTCQRRFVRENVDLHGKLRSRGMTDTIEVINIDPNGMVCSGAPYVEEGTTVELVFEDDELMITYRFKATVKWRRDAESDNYELGLQLVGVPLMIRHGLMLDLQELELVAA